MDITNRTVLIVGGTSGIGLGLARRFAAAGSTVIVGGRHPEAVTGLAPELATVTVDVTRASSVLEARDDVLRRFPELDVVVTMSGVLLQEDLRDPAHGAQAEETIQVNLLGTIRVVDAFTPHLLARGAATGRADVMTVSSGIAFLPFPLMASYGASKAGVHAYTEALRAQLAGSGVEVTELIPPAVATAGQEKVNPAALPLDGYLDEVIGLLTAEPTPREVVVAAAQYLRWAERDGTYAELLAKRSEALRSLPGR
ncbi:SDR family oxidoreductase [Frigoribacterium sp. 2-23]|uniref:SDR family oxidoreductase n=1 Tax=Frigoribacterium sp. 2-23 TaxID=3415006 RepID=UPI003C6F3EA1